MVWSLQLTGEPDALMRVLSALRRRRWCLEGVHYELGDAHRPGTRLSLRARSDGGRPGTMQAWLAGLPDVLEVTCEEG